MRIGYDIADIDNVNADNKRKILALVEKALSDGLTAEIEVLNCNDTPNGDKPFTRLELKIYSLVDYQEYRK